MSGIVKRSVAIRGHRTSYSLEQPFHDELARIARERGMALAGLVCEVDQSRPRGTNLSSALRLYVLEQVRTQPAEPGAAEG